MKRMGHGAARPIEYHIPRPGPVHDIRSRSIRQGLFKGQPAIAVGRPMDMKGPAHVLPRTNKWCTLTLIGNF